MIENISENPPSMLRKKRNSLMNQMVILKESKVSDAVKIPEYIQTNEKQAEQGERQKATMMKKRFSKLKLSEIKAKSFHQIIFSEMKYMDLRDKKLKQRKIPRSILSILYRQKVKNYNPFLKALKQLHDMKDDLVKEDIERANKLCYMGIARQFLLNKRNGYVPPLTRVGILIRNYMLAPLRDFIKTRKLRQKNTIFIPINKSALSFNPNNFPSELSKHIHHKKYSQILKQINKIIENEFIEYKMSSQTQLKNRFTYSEVVMVVAMIGLIIGILLGGDSQVLQRWQVNLALVSAFGLSAILGVVGSWVESKKKLNQVCSSNNVTQKIEKKIQEYFNSVSQEGKIVWKVGKSFYWVEVHLSQIRRRKGGKQNDFYQ